MKPMIALSAAILLTSSSSPVVAQKKQPRARGIGFSRLVRHRLVLKELKVTTEQRKKLQDASAVAQKATKAASSLKIDARRKKAREINRTLRAAVAETLDEKQNKRLLQIEMQYSSGSWIVARKGVGELIDLSREQKKKIREISNKMSAEIRKLREAQNDDNKQQTQREVAGKLVAARKEALAVLSPEQLKKWKSAMGEPLKLPRGKRKKKQEQSN